MVASMSTPPPPPPPAPPPPPPPPPYVLSTLGEDLLLLSVRPQDGRIMTLQRISYGLMGSELVRLAAAGRVDIVSDRIVVRFAAPTGDAELDVALASITQARRPPRPRAWVGRPRRSIRDEYLARLVSAGALHTERGGIFGGIRYRIAAPDRVAAARSRLDGIAQSSGPVDVTQAAFGGLAHAVGLDRALYPGFGARPLRKRLTEIATGKWTAAAPGAAAVGPATAAVFAAAAASSDAAIRAATAAATQAATQAAMQAATDAAVAAAAAASAVVSSAGGG
jgi:hypothetical protein